MSDGEIVSSNSTGDMPTYLLATSFNGPTSFSGFAPRSPLKRRAAETGWEDEDEELLQVESPPKKRLKMGEHLVFEDVEEGEEETDDDDEDYEKVEHEEEDDFEDEEEDYFNFKTIHIGQQKLEKERSLKGKNNNERALED